MTNLKPQQRRVLNTIKVFNAEYQGEVPYNIIKLEIDIPEEDLTSILGFLEQNGYISINSGMINFVKEPSRDEHDVPNEVPQPDNDEIIQDSGVEVDKVKNEPNVEDNSYDRVNLEDGNNDNVNTQVNTENPDNSDNHGEVEADPKNEFSEREQLAMDTLRKMLDDSGNISRSLMEGTLLYGDLGLSSISMYNLVTSLEYKGILKKITLIDGEYYKFTPKNS